MNIKNKLEIDGLKNEGLDSVSPIERREFLKIGLAITGVFAGGTIFSAVSHIDEVFGSQKGAAAKLHKTHYSMLIRQDRCIDCERCVEACAATNNVPSYGYRTRILERAVPDAIGQKAEFIPVLCNQCNSAPCVMACPTKASYKDQQTGIVLIDGKKCIGCKVCVTACPYEARYFNEEKHAIDKCNFCFDTRLSKGEKLTACAAACPTGARVFGDLSDPNSDVYQAVHQIEKVVWVMRPEVGTKPNVFYTKGYRDDLFPRGQGFKA